MQLVEHHLIDRHDPRWQAIDAAAFASKHLYNAALYLTLRTGRGPAGARFSASVGAGTPRRRGPRRCSSRWTPAPGRARRLCPYCDGWEWRDAPIALYGTSKDMAELALEMTGWSRDPVIC